MVVGLSRSADAMGVRLVTGDWGHIELFVDNVSWFSFGSSPLYSSTSSSESESC